MAPRLSFSGETLTRGEIGEFHAVALEAVRGYFSPANPRFVSLFAGLTPAELQESLSAHEKETDRLYSLSLLASLEAVFRQDFLRRVVARKKDALSQAFRDIYKEHREMVSLEEHILASWKEHHPETAHLISEFKGTLKFRHWLAHGRYWEPNLARDHDFYEVSLLAEALISDLNLEPTEE